MPGADAVGSGRRYDWGHVEEEERICWIINLERKTLKLEALEYKKYSSFTFIDPLKNIFGFASFPPSHRKKDGKDMQLSLDRAKEAESRPRETTTSPLNQSTHLNSEFYKNYLESRNRSKDSKRDSFNSNYANLSVDLGEPTRPGFTRPITSRQGSNNYTSKQEPNSSFESRPNTIHNISQYARNSYNNNPKMTRSTYDPPKQEPTEPQTDRRERTSGNSSPVVTTHEKFYKRVKDILKK